MSRIKIMHVIGNLHLGGAEKLAATVVSTLAPNEFEASICCLGLGGHYAEQLQGKGIPVYALGHQKNLTLHELAKLTKVLLQLRTLFTQHRVDIVHTHLFGTGLLGRIAAKMAGVPTIIHTFHRIGEIPFETAIERALSKWTTAYVVDSYAIGQVLESHYSLDRAKVHVIHNGINASEFTGLMSKAEAKYYLGLPQERKVVAIIAHLSKVKRQAIYLKAFRDVIKTYPNTTLILVGDGPERRSLENQAHELGIGNHVLFLGYRKDLACILAATDLLVHPSDWEGFGIILAEAMYCEIPVITTDTGGGAEVVAHLETGILLPPGDVSGFTQATLSILHDPDLASTFGSAGRARVEKMFLQPKMTAEYERFYRCLARAV